MILEPIKPRVLAVRSIPQVDAQLASELNLEPHHRSVGLITCTIDDSLYAALDEGTKCADVDVVYAKSFYAGAAHASGPFSGEIIGVFAARDSEEVSSGLQGALRYLENKAWFYSADDRNELAFFPHVIPSVGRYLAAQAEVEPGTSMAYLIAPPIEAMLALDQALKVADAEMKVFYPPPSETNFSGGLLVGDQPSVEAAAQAFQETVLELAGNPHRIDPKPDVEELATVFGRKSVTRPSGNKPYRLLESGLELETKPDGFTHLQDNQSLVSKSNPVIRFRGELDLLQGLVIEAGVSVCGEGHEDVAEDLEDVLQYLRQLLSAEVTGRPIPTLSVGGFDAEELHRISHNTMKYMGVGWVLPESSMGVGVAKLNLLRARARQVELAAMEAMAAADHVPRANREALLHGLNRLSNALYVLVCKLVSRR